MTRLNRKAGESHWHGIGLTDRGRVRRSNQDAYAVLNDRRLWIVADGMGGRAGGEVASRIAVETLTNAFTRDDLDSGECSGGGPHNRMTLLRRAIHTSNHAIRQEATKRPSLIGMGTTVVMALIAHETSAAIIAHVGDSRAYVLRGGSLIRLTGDHSFVEDAVRDGRLSEEQALEHPLRHVLTRALGAESEVEPDISVHVLLPDDVLLLCTDGLTKMLNDTLILSTLLHAQASSTTMCTALINEANRLGGEDNVTVVLVKNELTNQGACL